MPTHGLILYSYYYANGVIDLTPDLASLVRPDDGPVRLLLGDDEDSIDGQVTRYFSRHYQKSLPRILGGEKLREWLQSEYQINHYIEINFISFEAIHFPGNSLSNELDHKDVGGLIEMFLGYIHERDWLEDTTIVPARRREIVRRGELAVDPLIEILTHSDWAVRHDVALMLGDLRNARAVDPLLITMMKDESKAVREKAVDALLRIGTPRALTLVKIYQNFIRQQRKES